MHRLVRRQARCATPKSEPRKLYLRPSHAEPVPLPACSPARADRSILLTARDADRFGLMKASRLHHGEPARLLPPEQRRREPAHARRDLEQTPRERLLCTLLGIEPDRRGGHEQSIELAAGERAVRDIARGQRNAVDQRAVRREATYARTSEVCDP